MRFFYTGLAFVAVPTVVLAATHTVMVGSNGQLKFDPDTVSASVGDIIQFKFMAKNHSVTQSLFSSPCSRAMFNGTLGVSSGFLAIPPNSPPQNDSQPTWSITIKDTTPLWFHCGQTMPVNHCRQGMVMSINPNAEKTQAAFLAAATASNSTVAPSNDTSAASATDSGAASSAAPASATDSGAASSTAPASATDSGAASSAALASSTDSRVAAATASGGSTPSPVSGTAAADNAQVKKNDASGIALTRGAATLFSVAAAVSAVLF